jgi:succinate dehydrogenase / fumarate reductase cytochrome b subunit
MASIKTTVNGYVRYKGREGQLSFLLHRITGLGTLLFLTIHILDTSTVFFFPELYNHGIEIYRTTLFGVGEIILIFCVIYHGVNGLRIAIFDWFPNLWTIESARKWSLSTLGLAIILWLPVLVIMSRNILIHNYGLFGG